MFNCATHSANIIDMLRMADIIIPSVTALLAIFIMCKYNFSEARSREVRAELEKRRGKV